MDNLSTGDSVKKLLKELQQLVEELKNDTKGTSQLELDLMKEKIRNIYDILSEVIFKKPPEEQSKAETITEPGTIPASEKSSSPEVITEIIMDVGEDEQVEVENSSTIVKNDQDQLSPSSEHTLNLFEKSLNNMDDNDNKSIGEKITKEKPIESIGEVIQSKKITNLKLAIGINEKFFFLNELFDGKMNEYNDAIEEMDQKDTFKDAIEQLVLLKEKKNWVEESEAYKQLKEFLERKFN